MFVYSLEQSCRPPWLESPAPGAIYHTMPAFSVRLKQRGYSQNIHVLFSISQEAMKQDLICGLGVHSGVMMPPHWILKLPRWTQYMCTVHITGFAAQARLGPVQPQRQEDEGRGRRRGRPQALHHEADARVQLQPPGGVPQPQVWRKPGRQADEEVPGSSQSPTGEPQKFKNDQEIFVFNIIRCST